MFEKLAKHRFLFEELVKRDFKKKYKRTILGMGWSMLSPLLTLLVMKVVFENFFGRNTAHYTTYLFCGNLLFAWFSEASSGGMMSLYNNAGIFSKVNVPKYLFLLSGSVRTLINFALTLVLFFVFCGLDHVAFTWRFVLLAYPVATMFLFNIGVGMALSALFIFFRDIQYLYRIALTLISYLSVIFYTIDSFSPFAQRLFLLNPIYANIKFWRLVVLEQTIPSLSYHLLLAFYAVLFLGIGAFFYKKFNHRFVYYF